MSEPKQIRLNLQHAESIVAAGACEIFAAYVARGLVEDANEAEFRQKALVQAARIAQEASRFISEGADRFDDQQEMGGGITILK